MIYTSVMDCENCHCRFTLTVEPLSAPKPEVADYIKTDDGVAYCPICGSTNKGKATLLFPNIPPMPSIKR